MSVIIFGRVGGEEFCVFLPAENQNKAAMIVKRICAEAERLAFLPAEGRLRRLTFSIGVVVSTKWQTTSQPMRFVDCCLYELKEQGRNRVVFAKAMMAAA